MSDTASTKVVTGIVRFSYVQVWEPKAIEDGEEKKYSTAILIPKSDKATIAAINKAIEAAKQQGRAKLGEKPGKLKLPLRDGDEEKPEDDNYAGMMFLNANAKKKPGIVDKDLNPIMDQDEFYSGCYGRASITFFAFAGKSKGIACGLNHCMKTKDGEPLGGGSTAEADFADVISAGMEEDDFLS